MWMCGVMWVEGHLRVEGGKICKSQTKGATASEGAQEELPCGRVLKVARHRP